MTQSADNGSDARTIIAGGRIRGTLRPPSSKSLTQRYLNLALQAATPSVLHRPLLSDDTVAFLAALQDLGCLVERRRGSVRVAPPRAAGTARLDCGAGGTMLRFLTAAVCGLPGLWTLDGTPRLRERPLAPLVEVLEALGARIDYLGAEGHAPVRVTGGRLRGGVATLDAGRSSQFLSALLMAAARGREALELSVSGLTSAPYAELTVAAMAEFGIEVGRPGVLRYRVAPTRFRGREVEVEGDASAACYPAAAAALTGGKVSLLGLRPEGRQGDLGFLDLLSRMGADVRWRGSRVEIAAGGRLVGIEADLSAMPDQVPTLAALAPFAAGATRITNVPHLRLKESDRLHAMSTELGRLGVPVEERPGALTIPGVWAEGSPPDDHVVVSSHDDHRIAMSLALVGLRRPGTAVARPGVVTKSYPDFWRDLDRLLTT